MEKANVTWMGKENQSEPDIDIKDPKAEAKRIDDYMNNEVDYDSLEEALTSQVRRVQFRGKTAAFQAVVIGSNPITRFGIGPYEDTLCRLDGGKDHEKTRKKFQLRTLI